MPLEAFARGIRAVKGRVFKSFKEVGTIDARRKSRAERELLLAKAHLKKEEPAGAIRHLSNVFANAWENGLAWSCRDAGGSMPLHVCAWTLMARAYLGMGDDKKATECGAVARLAASELMLIGNGIARMKKGDDSGASRDFSDAENAGKRYAVAASALLGRKLKGGGATGLVSRGYLRMLSGNFKGALADFDAALESDGDNFEARAAKASALDALGRHEEAEKWYAKVRVEAEKKA